MVHCQTCTYMHTLIISCSCRGHCTFFRVRGLCTSFRATAHSSGHVREGAEGQGHRRTISGMSTPGQHGTYLAPPKGTNAFMDVVGAKALLSRISNGEHPNSVTRKLHLPSRFLAVAAAEIPDEHPEVQLLVGISADELVERLILLVDIAHIDQCVNNWKLEVLPTLSDTYHACKHCQHMQAHTHTCLLLLCDVLLPLCPTLCLSHSPILPS